MKKSYSKDNTISVNIVVYCQVLLVSTLSASVDFVLYKVGKTDTVRDSFLARTQDLKQGHHNTFSPGVNILLVLEMSGIKLTY